MILSPKTLLSYHRVPSQVNVQSLCCRAHVQCCTASIIPAALATSSEEVQPPLPPFASVAHMRPALVQSASNSPASVIPVIESKLTSMADEAARKHANMRSLWLRLMMGWPTRAGQAAKASFRMFESRPREKRGGGGGRRCQLWLHDGVRVASSVPARPHQVASPDKHPRLP